MDNIINYEESNLKIIEIKNIITKYTTLKKTANPNYTNNPIDVTSLNDPIENTNKIENIFTNTIKPEISRIHNEFFNYNN